jgi:hypothetical protein
MFAYPRFLQPQVGAARDPATVVPAERSESRDP